MKVGRSNVRVAAYQFDVRRGEVGHNVERVAAGLREAASHGVELVVLPEMWPTSFVEVSGDEGDWIPRTEEALAEIAALSGELGLAVCGSGLGAAGADERPRNRLHVLDRGERVLAYDKLHLFSPTGEREAFSAGEELPPTVETSVGRVSGVICYDLRFGVVFHRPFDAGAEILVVPAQWPTARATHWRALVLGRAVENQCFVVAANRTGTEVVGRRRLELPFGGGSLVASPDGVVLAEGGGEPGLVRAELEWSQIERVRTAVPLRRDRRAGLET